MSKNLVIVESPSKAKTIEKYLGSTYKVHSSYGHVRDLEKQNKGIDIEKGFEPRYIISQDKKTVIDNLKKEVRKSDSIWLATDDDREGEAISWHLYEVLDLHSKDVKRIVFREITKKAITKAIENPRRIDMNLVLAQQARRILDRLVGFELSPILWKKIQVGLSAGRVQSVALRMVVEREREIENFQRTSYFRISAIFFTQEQHSFKAEITKKIESKDIALEILNKCIGAKFFIETIEKKTTKRNPSAPFTTSTLQQEASGKMGFSIAQTMSAAQKLYEAGHITYMRTDSNHLSQEAIEDIQSKIGQLFGNKYVEVRQFKTKSKSAQEAHEAIRPTDINKKNITSMGSSCERLYKMIWIRTLACQMASCEIKRTTVKIPIPNTDYAFVGVGEFIQFDGFLKIYTEFTNQLLSSFIKNLLPALKEGQELNLEQVESIQKFSSPPTRYTEGSLVKKLEEMGIGRPSTYVPTISTIQNREYVIKEDRDGKEQNFEYLFLKGDKITEKTKTEITGSEKSKLFPTSTGVIVSDFLNKYFADVINYSFTAEVETEFDAIASGSLVWNAMLKEFYGDFHENIIQITETVDRDTAGSIRKIGIHPETNEDVLAKIGRYGPYIQIGENPSEEGKKPKYAAMRKGQMIDKISLEEALDLFKLPRTVGSYEDAEMTATIGRFGPYIKHKNKFYSLAKDYDPHTIKQEEAIYIIEEKRKADANKYIRVFEKEEIEVLNGRYGPYIKYRKKNFKIPKDKEASALTLEECEDIIKNSPTKSKRKRKVK